MLDKFLVGEYRHQIDEKSRLRMPPKLKEQLLTNRLCVMCGTDNCLYVLPESDAKEFFSKQFANAPYTRENAAVQRKILAATQVVEEDGQGRYLIPQKLLEFAKIKDKEGNFLSKNLVTIGANDHVEIWAENIWDEYSDISDEDLGAQIANLMFKS